MFHGKSVRSRLDDVAVPLSDRERRWLTGRSRTIARKYREEHPDELLTVEMARQWFMDRAKVPSSTGEVEFEISPRTLSAGSIKTLERLCTVEPEDVPERTRAFDEAFGERYNALAELVATGELCTSDIADLGVWLHQEILTILPWDHANLLLVHTLTLWAVGQLGIEPASPIEEGDADARERHHQIERDVYDRDVEEAVLKSNPLSLKAWLDYRIRRWMERQLSVKSARDT